MSPATGKHAVRAAVLAAVLAIGIADKPFSFAADTKKEEKFGSVEVRVVLKGKNQPAPGAYVTVEGNEYFADGDGVFRMQRIRAKAHIVSAELNRKEGGFFGFFAKTVRYVGFRDVFVDADKKTVETLEIEAVQDLNALCHSCHPEERTREHRVVKCVHASGVELPPAYIGAIQAFNARNEQNRKEGKKFYPDIVYEKRIVRENDREVEKSFLVCESCHTLHKSNGPRAFVRMPFEQKSVLCRGCHV